MIDWQISEISHKRIVIYVEITESLKNDEFLFLSAFLSALIMRIY